MTDTVRINVGSPENSDSELDQPFIVVPKILRNRRNFSLTKQVYKQNYEEHLIFKIFTVALLIFGIVMLCIEIFILCKMIFLSFSKIEYLKPNY